MRTIERWNNLIRSYTIKKLFTPRISSILLEDSNPPDNLYTEGSAYIYGPQLTGKTIYASYILLEEEKNLYLAGKKKSCIFVSVPDLFQEIKSTFNNPDKSEEEILNKYRDAHLLVMDDFGTVKTSDWVLQVLYMIVNHRYEYQKKTIYTSNLSLNEAAELLGDDRITSRIERDCYMIKKTKV